VNTLHGVLKLWLPVCRTPATATHLHTLAATSGDRLSLLSLDVADQASIAEAGSQLDAKLPRLNVLINNAGVFAPSKSVVGAESQLFASAFAINATGPFLVLSALLPILARTSGARVINITMPTRPIAQLTRTENHAFVASRYALNALTKMAANELHASGVAVHAIWPGYLRTDMNSMAADATEPSEAIPGVVDLIERLSLTQSGQCYLPDGKTFEW
jgi:NAD(P)-dependent dehydrogenase (short-subunit alcohol dehydrogenase family)